MKDLAGKLGKLVFPDVEEKKGRRIVIQIIAGLFIALISMAGMLFYQHQEVKQQQKFQQIKGRRLPSRKNYWREKGQNLQKRRCRKQKMGMAWTI